MNTSHADVVAPFLSLSDEFFFSNLFGALLIKIFFLYNSIQIHASRFRDLLLLEYDCQPTRVHVKRVKAWELYMYVVVGDDDIQGLTLYMLHGMYNEESSRKNKASEQRASVSVKSEIQFRRC